MEGSIKISLIVFFISILIISCKENDSVFVPSKEDYVLHQKAKVYINPLPTYSINDKNDIERLRIDLGEKLFSDSILSFNQTQSCNTCHPLDKFGMDNKRVSEGDNGRTGVRNTPTVYNSSLQFAQFWDARVTTLEEQALGPIFGIDEMGMKDTLEVIKRVKNKDGYQQLFKIAYPDADTSITIQNIANCLAAFEKTLITSNDRFDQYLKGDLSILNEQEKRGLASFIDKGCIPCHSGALLGGNMNQKFAVYGYYWDYTGSTHFDKGKYQHTHDASDKFVFKVPTLRNIAKTGPYFHDGSVDSLSEAVRIMARAELNTSLSNAEIEDIVAFMKVLSGKISFNDNNESHNLGK